MVKLFYGKVKTYGTNAGIVKFSSLSCLQASNKTSILSSVVALGKEFTNSTDFGQWPLCVAGYTDIHQSLEAGLAEENIETNSEQTSTREVCFCNYISFHLFHIFYRLKSHCLLFLQQWFTKLPPVLTFELSRFSYSTTLTQAVKLHNMFTFPHTLYLDR